MVGSISGTELTGAAHRLIIISNTQEQNPNEVIQELKTRPAVKKPLKEASTCPTDLFGAHPFASRTRPPAGPPGYERGFYRSQVLPFSLMSMKKTMQEFQCLI
jgi:hypothetical protein